MTPVTAAALYFDPEQGKSVPLPWFERARSIFDDFSLSPVLFTAAGGGFEFDDCYVLADRGDVRMFGESLLARRAELLRSLRDGEIRFLGLDSPQRGAEDREQSRASASVSLIEGMVYFDGETGLFGRPGEVLRRCLETAHGCIDVRYGIAYTSRLSDSPDMYAMGAKSYKTYTIVDFKRELLSHSLGSGFTAWHDELMGPKRHLTGHFRGAYPASLLSDAHLRRLDPTSLGLGALSPLAAGLWLWTLDDSEIVQAEEVLNKMRLLIK